MCVVLLYLTPSMHFVSSSYMFNTEASPNPRNDKNTHDIRHPVFFFLQFSSDSFSEDEYLLTGASLTFLIRTSSFSPLSIKLVSINGLTMMLVFPFFLVEELDRFPSFCFETTADCFFNSIESEINTSSFPFSLDQNSLLLLWFLLLSFLANCAKEGIHTL